MRRKKIIGLILVVVMSITALAACSPEDEEIKDIDIKEIHEQVKEELGEDYYPDREMSLEEIEDYINIDAEFMDEYIAEAPMITMNVDTFIAIKAKEGKGDEVAEKLENHRQFLIDESMQYPMNLPKINAAKVIQHGDYAFFLMLGKNNDSMEDAEGEEALEFAKAQVKRAEDVVNSFFK